MCAGVGHKRSHSSVFDRRRLCVRVCARAQDEISMHEFEQFALDRMRVLKAIDAAKAKGVKPDEMRTTVDKLCAQYLPLRDDLGPFGEQYG